jgi:thiamine-phosphate pyrophosphorylase
LPLPVPPLLLITDRRQARVPLEEVVAGAFAAGCRWLSLREKDMAPAERAALLARLVALGRTQGAKVGLHGDAEEAARAGADGVHLPSGGDARAARARLGQAALIGLSCHGFIEIVRAAQMGADYVTLSPIFPSSSKPGYGPALGPLALGEVAREVAIPVLALGGITPENLPRCLEAGAAGAAVIGAVMAAANPGAAMAALLQCWNPRAATQNNGRVLGPARE